MSPSPVESREWKVRSGVDGVNSYGGNDTSTRSGQGEAFEVIFGFEAQPSGGALWQGREGSRGTAFGEVGC